MATRFYLPSSGAAGITPATSVHWVGTAGAVVRRMDIVKASTAMTSTTLAVNNASSTASTLFAVYVSDPLEAQLISGTNFGQVRMNVSNVSGCTAVSAVVMLIVNSAGAIVATISAAGGVVSGGSALTTTLTNRQTTPNSILDAYTCATGDRLVLEIGVIRTAGTTNRNGVLNFGDNSATDLAVDNATTTANNPYMEFSHNFVFQTYQPRHPSINHSNPGFF
jgi:hypothetical protein